MASQVDNRMRSRSRSLEFDPLPPAPRYSRSPVRNYSPPADFRRSRSPGRFSGGDRSRSPVPAQAFQQGRGRFSCEECVVICNTYQQLQHHLGSRRHLLRMETLEREMREAQDSRQHFERRSQRERRHGEFRDGPKPFYFD
jgi:hypothetical protein